MSKLKNLPMIALILSFVPAYVSAGEYIYAVTNPNVFAAQGLVKEVIKVVDNNNGSLVRQTVVVEVGSTEHVISCALSAELKDTDNTMLLGPACPTNLVNGCGTHVENTIGSTTIVDPREDRIVDVTVSSVKCTDGWRGSCLLASGAQGTGVFALENPHTVLIGGSFWLRPYSYCN